MRLSLTAPQAEFVQAQDAFPAIVAGFGAGKTEALCARLLLRKVCFPAGWVAYYAPTYDLVNLIAVPRIEQMLEEHGYSYKMNSQKMMMAVHGMGSFVFRTMASPERIIGYQCADSGVDELDTLKKPQAEHAWNKIIARNRQKKPTGEPNTVAVATTPEGFRFTHARWVKHEGVREGSEHRYRIIRASTYSNRHNLADGYIENLEASYQPQLLRAYLRGEFVNLTSGAVYPDFDRRHNATTQAIGPAEAVHIGMDFNVYNMAATVSVIRDGRPLTLAELVKVRDTPSMVEAIRTRYGNAGRSIVVYPDASGGNVSSKGASISDIALLRGAGFIVEAGLSNPPVKDRVASVNSMVLNAKGERRWLINPDACPTLTEAIEQQVYDQNGDPDKSSGHDHACDAIGYFMHRRFPVRRPQSAVMPLAA